MRRASRIGIPRAARFRKPRASSADYTRVLPALCSKLRASPARFERTRHAFAVAPRMRPYELPPISTTAICGSRLSGAHRATRQWQTLSAVLICAYFVAGVFGRFPWKADEPYSFGIVWDMVERHSWLVPHIAGEPFVEKPPLVYWLGALFAKLLPMVPAHESSRGAISLLALATVIPLYVAAEYLHSEAAIFVRQLEFRDASGGRMSIARSVTARTYALLAIVLMTGTLGIPEHVHKLSADLGQLAGAMLGLCGLIKVGADSVADRSADRAAHSRVAAAALFGTGVGVAFMSKGLFVPGTLVATWLCCAFIPAYRRRTTAVVATTALASALPWMLVWPILLYHASPALFGEWLWDQNLGRFLGQVALGGNNVSFASKVLSAVVMGFPPVLLCASVAVRILVLPGVGPARRWTLIRDAPAHACIAIYLAILLLALGVSASMRDVYLLPAVPAMILLGLPALMWKTHASSLRVKHLVDVGFGAVAILVGLIWLALVTTGTLASLPWLQALVGQWLPLPFELAVRWPAIIVAVMALITWSYVSRHSPLESVTIAWCSGVTMLWIVVFALLLPWIDAARSYEMVFAQVMQHVGPSDGCVATLNLGESELALFQYVTRAEVTRSYLGHSGSGDRSRPNPAAMECAWLLVLSNRSSGSLGPDSDRWTRIWTGSRPADTNERFALYRAKVEPRPL